MEVFSRKLSRVARHLEPSRILALTAEARRLKEEGADIISLAAGEPDFETPAVVGEAGVRAIGEGATRYTAAAGEPALRRKVAEVYSRRWGIELSAGQVCITSGAKPALYCLVSILLDPGEELLYALPYWASYEPIVQMRGGLPVAVPTRAEDGFKLTAAALDAALTDRSKILLLNSPGNPSGSVYSAEELLDLAEVIRDRDLIVLSDEIYEALVFDGLKHQSLYPITSWMRERCVMVSGFSKSYAMTGWRVGYAIGDEDLITTLGDYQSHSHSCPCQISQRAALTALDRAEDDLATMHAAFARRLEFCRARMKETGLPYVNPQGAFYVFFDTASVCAARGWADGEEFCARLLAEQGLVLIPGGVFGMPSWVRLSFAASDEELAAAFERLGKFLA